MALSDWLLDRAGDVLSGAVAAVGGAAGAVFGPVGIAAGSAVASSAYNSAVDFLFGNGDEENQPSPQTTQSGLTPTGAPQFPSPGDPGFGGLPGIPGANYGPSISGQMVPQDPGGGLVGPVYGTQGLPSAALQALNSVMQILKAYTMISDFVQRQWNFPRETAETAPKSQALWTALARQVPASHRDALEQFLVGFPAPVGLSKTASDVFLTLMIAEAGYTPDQIGCCPK